MDAARYLPDRERTPLVKGQAEGLVELLRLAQPQGHTRTSPMHKETGPVVLIPAHNEAATIAHTICSLKEQTVSPSSIIVICDNCTDNTAQISRSLGAIVLTTVDNKARKAGALNQGLKEAIPYLRDNDFVVTIDADSHLSGDWIQQASLKLRRRRRAGAVCGVVVGESDHGLIGQLQQNEYVRGARTISRMQQVRVLSGCGTMFRVDALRKIAEERGTLLPGTHGQYFNQDSITEDYEITLALKSLGFECIFSEESVAVTELMPTWADLFRQRLRWQQGTLGDLRRYGLAKATRRDWGRQFVGYLSYIVVIACWIIITQSFLSGAVFSPAWGLSVLGVSLVERTWTVRRAGVRGIFLAALMLPELCYGLFEAAYLARAGFAQFGRTETSWNHLQHADPGRRRIEERAA